MARLLINIDHIATLRNARGEGVPDIIEASEIALKSGAEGVVFHLREDRRHIKDEDVNRLFKELDTFFDFEMAATDEMIKISKNVKPHIVTLVPENRMELTTEGGLNMNAIFNDYKSRVVPQFNDANIPISLFVDPNHKDIELAAELGVEAIELHTGTFALAKNQQVQKELLRLKEASVLANQLGLKVNAGHGLNVYNLPILLEEVPFLNDISIGHAIISRSVFVGLEEAVKELIEPINNYTHD